MNLCIQRIIDFGGNDMPEVSVIMSVYNLSDKKILEQSIGSILQQTFEDLELIICDDGSTDDTVKILRQIARKDSRIRLIENKENRKAGYARNTCIKYASGRYIAIMDADDCSHPQRIEKQREYMEEHPEYGFVGSRGEFFVYGLGDDEECYWFCEEPEPRDFLFSLPFVHASCMFRKEVLEKVQGYDCAKHVVRSEDYDMLLRIYGEGYRAKNLQEVLYYIRRDENQYRRRKYRYRFNEAYIKYRGFKKLGLMPQAMLYVIKPVIVGLIPIRLTAKIQKLHYSKKQG